MLNLRTCLFISLSLLAQPVLAEECDEEKPIPTVDDNEKPFFSFLDEPQKSISSGLKSFATTLDEFFADENVYYDTSGSYIKITADTIWQEGGDIGYRGDIKLKLRLPKTQEKIKLIFESDPEDREDDVAKTAEPTIQGAVEEKSYYAGIQGSFGKKEKWQFKPSIGLRLHNPPDLFTRFRFSRTADFNSWLFRFNETIFWFDSIGWGEDTTFQFDFNVLDDVLFRATTFGRWTNQNQYFDLSQSFSFIHTLSKRRAISYDIGAFGISEPKVHATNYLLGVRYRQIIHSDYLFLELIPQIDYRKEHDFRAEYSFTLRLEMVFSG